jgi:hypothetical protein
MEIGLVPTLAQIEEEILLCRCSAQKIATDSGKKLQKNKIKPKKIYHPACPRYPFKKKTAII